MLQRAPRSIYAAFDVFPSRKGAAIHIGHFAQALFTHTDGGLLYVLGNSALPAHQREGNIEIVRSCEPATNYLTRARIYSERLAALVARHGDALDLCHFRDVWSGGPLLAETRRHAALFEVNALPSIELPFAYDGIAPATLAKIRAQENFCLTQADHIVTPSRVLQAKIISRGIEPEKITVIPNGANLLPARARPADAPARYLLYFGALQAWQGIDTLLRAFARLADLPELHLVICASFESRAARSLQRLAESLRVTPRVVWRFALPEEELAPWREHAELSVAPLTECARNIKQGCAPLKILESMAAGVPVVASDLPAVRELMRDGEHGRLVRPDRPGELARAIRVLLHYPAVRAEMGRRAREHVAREFQWQHAVQRLNNVYSELLARRTAGICSGPLPPPPPNHLLRERTCPLFFAHRRTTAFCLAKADFGYTDAQRLARAVSAVGQIRDRCQCGRRRECPAGRDRSLVAHLGRFHADESRRAGRRPDSAVDQSRRTIVFCVRPLPCAARPARRGGAQSAVRDSARRRQTGRWREAEHRSARAGTGRQARRRAHTATTGQFQKNRRNELCGPLA
ncbi:MAG: glycosyltransferase family 1 protein [Opitutus sp.]|nr:glycosyltransferase family 1 protein [Opitutus sp.]